jgi:hypothetical protein
MNVQAKYNNDLFLMLPLITEILRKTIDVQTRSNIIAKTLNEAGRTVIPIADMSAYQKTQFQRNLLEVFKYRGELP